MRTAVGLGLVTVGVVFLAINGCQDNHSRSSLMISTDSGPSSSVLVDHHPRRGRSQRVKALTQDARAQKDLTATENASEKHSKLISAEAAKAGAKVTVKGGTVVKGAKAVKPPPVQHNMEKHKPWTPAQKKVEEDVMAAMSAKHAKMEAAAKKSALADYWRSIKSSLNTEKTRLGHYGAALALDRANRESFDDATSSSNHKILARRNRLLNNKLSEMKQEREMETEAAYKAIQSHKISYSACGEDCQEARSITSGAVNGGGGSSYFSSSFHDNYLSHSNGYDQSADSHDDDDDFSAGR